MKKIKNVIIFSDSHDWHSNQLKKELKKLKCKVFCLSLDDCFINTNNNVPKPSDWVKSYKVIGKRICKRLKLILEKFYVSYPIKYTDIGFKNFTSLNYLKNFIHQIRRIN